MGAPVFSVIIPAYRCGEYIEQAITSVEMQLVEYELIIIDDASGDQTEQVVQSHLANPRIHYYKNKNNMGVSYCRNKGIKMARGKYLAFLDADDWWKPEKLQKQQKIMEEGWILCHTGRKLYKHDGTFAGGLILPPERLDVEELLKTNVIACSSVVVRSEAFETIKWEHDEVHEDYLVWLRILEKYGKACGIREPLLCSRLREEGKSRKKINTIKMTYGVYRLFGVKKSRACYYVGSHLIRSFSRYYRAEKRGGE